MKNEFLSTQDLGSLLGVTRQTIRNWIKKGEIEAFQIGQNLKIPVHESVRLLHHYGLPFPDWLTKQSLKTPQKPASSSKDAWPADPSIEASVARQDSSKRASHRRAHWSQSARDVR